MNNDGENGLSLPDGWVWLTIGDVTSPIEKVDPTQKPDKEFTYLDIASIDNSVHKITEPKSYYGADAPSRARQLVQANDVIFSTVRTYLEKIAQVPEIYDGQIASTGFSVLRANEIILPKYLFHYSLSKEFLEPLNELQRGTSYPAVRDGDVRAQLIPVAPLPEQERIVNRIEELFSDLEAGVAALERVRVGLKHYKASVLKAAVDGKLLVSREIKRSGDEVQEGWKLVKLGSLTSVVVGYVGPISKDYTDEQNGVPLLSTTNISVEGFVSNEKKFITREFHNRNKKSQANPGDILVARHGVCGASVIVPENLPESHVLNAVIIKKTDLLDSKFITYFMNLKALTGGVDKSKTGSVQAIINTSVVKEMLILLPPLDEQRRIVAEVERRLSVVGEVESAVEAGLVRAGRLRQSVLRSAFEGRL